MLFKILHFAQEPGIPELFYKKGVLKNLSNFSREHKK